VRTFVPMKWMKYLNATRPVNLLMTVFILYSMAYGILSPEIGKDIATLNFALYVVSAVSLMAFGYLVNDFYDVETDKINKPGKNIFESENPLKPKTLALLLLSIGLLFPIIFFLKNYGQVGLFVLYLFAAATLYLYARFLKNSVFIGNLSIAMLSGLMVSIPYLFFTDEIDLYSHQALLVSIYAVFAFLVTLLREIVKDAEDVEGDGKSNIKTLASYKGISISRYFSSVLMVISLVMISGTGIYFVQTGEIIKGIAFFLLAVCGFFPFFKIVRATDKKHFSQVSSALKIWMLLGVISMWI
jgi:4-hydroxybenzoate polyprenyltransferase